MPKPPLVLFDGVCNLCNGAVQWILRQDRRGVFRFASLQSEAARAALRDAGAEGPLPDSVVVLDERGVHTRSSAAFAIARGLGLPWSLLAVAAVLPRPVRDAAYALIAANRYRWFGVRETCTVPTPELKARFLDADEPVSARSSPPSVAQEKHRPSPAWAFLLRAVLAYLVIYIFPFPLGGIPGVSILDEWYTQGKQYVITAIAEAVFVDEITAYPAGSGDTTYNYIELLVYLVLALAAAGVWSAIVRWKPVHGATFDRWSMYIRVCLAAIMLGYGFAKVFPLQMPAPGAARLMQPIGDASPMGLLWTFIGVSTPYQIFAGASEVLAGLLLLFRRTALVGALVTVGVMTNVVALNFCYDVPVKQFSSHLLFMALFLVAPHAARLASVLILNLPAQPRALDPYPFARRPVRIGVRAILICYGLYCVVGGVVGGFQGLEQRRDSVAIAPELQGVYRVESFVRDGVADRALEDKDRWVRVGLDANGLGFIQRADGLGGRRGVSFDETKKTVTMRRRDAPEPDVLSYAIPEAGVLTLEGVFEGAPIAVRLRLNEADKPLLTTRGFRWINEVPFNR